MEEKNLLIQAIVKGQIDKGGLSDNTLVCTENNDFFLGLMIAASPGNEAMTVICLGEAVNAKKDLFLNIE